MAETIWVGLSGGVDSAVAALLLSRQGAHVVGVTLRLRGGRLAESGDDGMERDIADARRISEALGIEHRVLDLSDRFCEQVVAPFIAEYEAGRTPNPCVLCNRRIKFGAMLDAALSAGADAVATGHYARVAYDPGGGRWQLFRADSGKDQSYVLYGLSQHQLAHIRFPLAGMDKQAVRGLAGEHGLPVADKGDSMEICFVPGDDHAAFIERYGGRPAVPGVFEDTQGHVLGRHKGLRHYTVGQRKGLGLALGRPAYVLRLDPERNVVVVGEESAVFAPALRAQAVNYVSIAPPAAPIPVQAKVRYQAAPAPAVLTPLGGDGAQLTFETPQRAVTPGQAVVFYQGDMVLGGGTIAAALGSDA